MRLNGVKRIGFSSTGSVYGEADVFPTPENAPFPIQTSLYAASKVAGEGLISAYATGFGFQAFIFRFVSILGERYSHGHASPRRPRNLFDASTVMRFSYFSYCFDFYYIPHIGTSASVGLTSANIA